MRSNDKIYKYSVRKYNIHLKEFTIFTIYNSQYSAENIIFSSIWRNFDLTRILKENDDTAFRKNTLICIKHLVMIKSSTLFFIIQFIFRLIKSVEPHFVLELRKSIWLKIHGLYYQWCPEGGNEENSTPENEKSL